MQTRRDYNGSAFLSGAFRPFFLAAAAWAAVCILLWVLVMSGSAGLSPDFSAVNWHSHEMIFGFVSAALAGFILTAVPNWTGRLPIRGMPLALLALFWLFGRLSMLAAAFFGIEWIALVDVVFPLALFLVVLREIVSGKNKRNFPVAILFGVFACANFAVHAERFGLAGLDGHGWRLGLGVIVMIISVIGGRVVPSFTRNWLANSAPKSADIPRLPAKPSSLDTIVLMLCGFALLLWVFAPNFIGSGIALMLAGLGQLLRVSRWRGLSAFKEAIVFVLHVGYTWVGLGLFLLGLSIVWEGFASTNAIHALTIGAVGTMIAAIMSRASLGHSGRLIKAGAGLSAVYILISVAVVLRLAPALFPNQYMFWIIASGSTWILAFGLYTALFIPLYFKPR